MADYCDDCGNKVYGGYCTWCHEEVFIAEQYERSEEPVPELLLEKIATFMPKQKDHSNATESKPDCPIPA